MPKVVLRGQVVMMYNSVSSVRGREERARAEFHLIKFLEPVCARYASIVGV